MHKLAIFLSTFLVCSVQAQWVQQQINLQTGWNAVCLKVDVTDPVCANVFAEYPIETVTWWCRSGDGTGGYTQSPDDPTPPAPDMRNWYANNAPPSSFFRLIGGESYLIKATAPTTLTLTGVPAMPVPILFGDTPSLCGFNLPAHGSVMLSEYFKYYEHLGTPLPFSGVNTNDASSVFIYDNSQPQGNAAVWVSSKGEGAIKYSGPFNIAVQSGKRILAFQGVISPQTLTIKNNANIPRVLHIDASPSLAPPLGQGGLAGPVPMLKSALDWSTGFPREIYEDFNLPWSTNLAAGAEIELRLLPKVSVMPVSDNAYQSILKISDLGSSDNTGIPGGVRCLYQIGVRAEGNLAQQTQPTGLWVGNVVLDGVNRAQMRSNVSNTWDTAAIQTANYPFTFRVILHVDEYGVTRLMKEAFLASTPGQENTLLASRTAAMTFRTQHPDAKIRRISSSNFPFKAPEILEGGSFAAAEAMLSAVISQAYNDKTNPFVHAYHPDHDNVDFRNGALVDKPNGAMGLGDYESWAVERTLCFTFAGSDPIGENQKWNISVTGGTYDETISGLNKTPIKTCGAFRLNKVSDVARILYVSGN